MNGSGREDEERVSVEERYYLLYDVVDDKAHNLM